MIPMQLPIPWIAIERRDLEAFEDDWLLGVHDAHGMPAVRFLAARYGGEKMYVPKRAVGEGGAFRRELLTPWLEQVAQAYDPALARTICRLRPGVHVYVPVLRLLEERSVARELRRRHREEGATMADLAQAFGLPRRKVRELLR